MQKLQRERHKKEKLQICTDKWEMTSYDCLIYLSVCHHFLKMPLTGVRKLFGGMFFWLTV